jgi:hypothetical protein
MSSIVLLTIAFKLMTFCTPFKATMLYYDIFTH